MNEEILIRAQSARPVSEQTPDRSPALSCELGASTLTCLLGTHRARLTAHLRLFAGLDAPAAGRVELFGIDSTDLGEQQRRALPKRIGFVPASSPLISALSGFDNLALPARYHGLGSEREIASRAEALLASIDYPADHRHLPAYMRPLQRRHLTIARAMMLDPEVLLVDDPFWALDETSRRLIGQFLVSLVRDRGMTLAMTSWDMAFTAAHATQILFIGDERVIRFERWEHFRDSGDADVKHYLEYARRNCAALG